MSDSVSFDVFVNECEIKTHANVDLIGKNALWFWAVWLLLLLLLFIIFVGSVHCTIYINWLTSFHLSVKCVFVCST